MSTRPRWVTSGKGLTLAIDPDILASAVLVPESGYGGKAVAFGVHRVQRTLVPLSLDEAVLAQLELLVEVV